MAYLVYSSRLGREIGLLDEAEWCEIEKLGFGYIKAVKAHRETTGVSLPKARAAVDASPQKTEALDHYWQITGIRLSHPDHLWMVRLANYGALCPACRSPFRTPRAKLCAECGYQTPDGKPLGPLIPSDIEDRKIDLTNCP